jgi:hypothetical protein
LLQKYILLLVNNQNETLAGFFLILPHIKLIEVMQKTKYIGILVLVMLFSSTKVAFGQLNSMSFIYGHNGDARILLQEYLQPYTNIIGSNMNGSWYNTANVHKIGGVDVTAMFSFAFAPTDVIQNDLLDVLGLSTAFLDPTIVPTAVGSLTDRPEIVSTMGILNAEGETQTFPLASYIHPDGMGRDFVPLPMAQISLGLVFGTEVSVRYLPATDIGFGTETGICGIGGKHSISQWIPIIKKLKFIDIAIQGGYSHVSSSVHQVLLPVTTNDPFPDFNWDDQFLTMDVSAWTVNLIASQTLPIVTLYEGIGYASSLAEVGMVGHFPINTLISDPASDKFGETTYTIEEDPITELALEGYSGFRINAGLRFKLGVFTIHYDFTKTMYVSHTAGIGFTFR